jgi:hypothetical protein
MEISVAHMPDDRREQSQPVDVLTCRPNARELPPDLTPWGILQALGYQKLGLYGVRSGARQTETMAMTAAKWTLAAVSTKPCQMAF